MPANIFAVESLWVTTTDLCTVGGGFTTTFSFNVEADVPNMDGVTIIRTPSWTLHLLWVTLILLLDSIVVVTVVLVWFCNLSVAVIFLIFFVSVFCKEKKITKHCRKTVSKNSERHFTSSIRSVTPSVDIASCARLDVVICAFFPLNISDRSGVTISSKWSGSSKEPCWNVQLLASRFKTQTFEFNSMYIPEHYHHAMYCRIDRFPEWQPVLIPCHLHLNWNRDTFGTVDIRAFD